jgi:hypothetical protein
MYRGCSNAACVSALGDAGGCYVLVFTEKLTNEKAGPVVGRLDGGTRRRFPSEGTYCEACREAVVSGTMLGKANPMTAGSSPALLLIRAVFRTADYFAWHGAESEAGCCKATMMVARQMMTRWISSVRFITNF